MAQLRLWSCRPFVDQLRKDFGVVTVRSVRDQDGRSNPREPRSCPIADTTDIPEVFGTTSVHLGSGNGRLFGRKRHQRSHLVWEFTLLAKQVLSQLSYTPTLSQ
jgi:hypothetical protein